MLASRGVAVALPALLAFLAVGGTAVANGGYFPTSWGWPTVAFLLVVAAAAIVGDRLPLGLGDVALVALLALFTGWTALSMLWSPSAAQPVRAVDELLVYATGVAAALVVTRRVESAALVAGVAAAATAVSFYALGTRLVPDAIGTYDPAGGYQLSAPLGYWNALGILAAIGALGAMGFAAHGERLLVRMAAAWALLVLLPTLYFTFSRGSWIAFGVGLVLCALLEPRRLRLALGLAAALPVPLLAVWLASRSQPLTHAGYSLAEATRSGHRLALVLLVLALPAAAVTAAAAWASGRFGVGHRGRRVLRVTAALAAAAAVAIALVKIGDPVAFVGRATDAFRADSAVTGGDLNRRLFSVSGHGRSEYWRVAWTEVRERPWLGGGAGSYERYWLRDRRVAAGVRNAHDLYLETLAELGPVGLALLVAALGVPLVVAVRARGRPLVAAGAGAYGAFLLHAAIDWDWQIAAVTLAALFCAASLVAAAREPDAHVGLRLPGRLAILAAVAPLAAFAFVAQVGNVALAAADRAAARDDPGAAEAHARRARSWLPWSYEPWQRLGEAELAFGRLEAARRSFREGLDRDSRHWALWLDLALTRTGQGRAAALARARELNPRSPEIAQLER